MGRERKRGESGIAAQYWTRTQAIKRLQVSLKDFRRLCILKGVFPRDPKKKSKGLDKTYFHKKDIQFLAREPLLNKFRAFKQYLKKRNKCIARHEIERARQLEASKPVLSLDHLIRERYPTFESALRTDLDDAISLINLYAQMPSGSIHLHSTHVAAECSKLVGHWNMFIARQGWLTKSFVSIKGFYFSASLPVSSSHSSNVDVTWLVPHKFNQGDARQDVDYHVLYTFLQFYVVLVRFVLFKLYSDAGLVYPPPHGSDDDCVLDHMQYTPRDDNTDHTIDSDSTRNDLQYVRCNLFRGMRFVLGRETPREMLAFLIASGCGTIVSDDDDNNNCKATHRIIDRNINNDESSSSLELIQPQWIFDSFNVAHILPIAPYAPNASLPPHLSPFVDDQAEGYVPEQRRVLDEWTQRSIIKKSMDNDDCSDNNDSSLLKIAPDTIAVREQIEVETRRSEYETYVNGMQQELGELTTTTKSNNDNDVDCGDDVNRIVNESMIQRESVEESRELAEMMLPNKKLRAYTQAQRRIEKKQAKNAKLINRKVALTVDSKSKSK